jgi:hypothetical protein
MLRVCRVCRIPILLRQAVMPPAEALELSVVAQLLQNTLQLAPAAFSPRAAPENPAADRWSG